MQKSFHSILEMSKKFLMAKNLRHYAKMFLQVKDAISVSISSPVKDHKSRVAHDSRVTKHCEQH